MSSSMPERRIPSDVPLVERPEVRLLLGLLVAAGLLLIFGLLADEVLEGGTSGFDRRIILSFRDPADPSRLLGPRWLAEMFRDITSLGSTTVLGIFIITIAGYLAIAKSKRALILVIAAVVGGQVISTGLKTIFQRARPDLIPGAPQVFTASFPSGHAMLSAVTYLTIGALLAGLESRPTLRAYYLMVACVLTGLVGVSRVALGVHWPTDVLAGWCVGAAWALACAVLAAWLNRAGQLRD